MAQPIGVSQFLDTGPSHSTYAGQDTAPGDSFAVVLDQTGGTRPEANLSIAGVSTQTGNKPDFSSKNVTETEHAPADGFAEVLSTAKQSVSKLTGIASAPEVPRTSLDNITTAATVSKKDLALGSLVPPASKMPVDVTGGTANTIIAPKPEPLEGKITDKVATSKEEPAQGATAGESQSGSATEKLLGVATPIASGDISTKEIQAGSSAQKQHKAEEKKIPKESAAESISVKASVHATAGAPAAIAGNAIVSVDAISPAGVSDQPKTLTVTESKTEPDQIVIASSSSMSGSSGQSVSIDSNVPVGAKNVKGGVEPPAEKSAGEKISQAAGATSAGATTSSGTDGTKTVTEACVPVVAKGMADFTTASTAAQTPVALEHATGPSPVMVLNAETVKSHPAASTDVSSATVASGETSMGSSTATALPHTTLGSSPTMLEVGVASGTLGWLKIRAELTAGGDVSASLAGGSHAVADKLRSELPALTSYLQEEHVQLSAIAIHSTLQAPLIAAGVSTTPGGSDSSGFGSQAGFSGSMSGGGAGGQPHQGTDSGVPQGDVVSAGVSSNDEDGIAVAVERLPDAATYGSGMGLGVNGRLSPVEYGSGGGWLNVRV